MLSSGLHRNAFYNIVGGVVPILVAFITIPIYIKVVGETRYGMISLVWIAFGYFGVFDLGLSRAAAYKLSLLRREVLAVRTSVFYTSVLMSLVMGLIASLTFYCVGALLGARFIGNPAMQDEVMHALPWIAAFFPIGLLGGIFSGCLQADERFLELNLQQSIGSILLQCAPLLFFYYGQKNLESAIIGAIAARTINVFWLGTVCVRWAAPAGWPKFERSYIPELFGYGGWITVSDVISPILNGLDQMIIGSTLGPKATAHYSIPFSMTSKVLIIPTSLSRALFPRLSNSDDGSAREMSKKALPLVSGVMALVCAPAIILAQPALTFWISDEFARSSHLSASILLVGMWFNSLGFIPWTFLQAQNKPQIVAKVHAIEVIPFIILLVVMVKTAGIAGAAVAWVIRISVDLLLQALLAKFHWSDGVAAVIPGGIVLASLAVTLLNPSLAMSLFFASAATALSCVWLLKGTDAVVPYSSMLARRFGL